MKTIRLGRRIYDNLQKAMGFVVAVHIPIAGLALLPLAFGAPPIMTPAIVAFLEMVIDPACSIVFEAEPAARNVMNRPPRDPRERLLHGRLVFSSCIQGLLALLGVAVVYVAVLSADRDVADMRALMLAFLTLANVLLIFSHRSLRASARETLETWNPWLWFGLGGVAALLAMTLSLPWLRDLFRLGQPNLDDLPFAVLSLVALAVALLIAKRWPADAGRQAPRATPLP